MLLTVLGTAAGGGLPQWNCACHGCERARAWPRLRRRHASLAVQADVRTWYVVNAGPDIADQIRDCAQLRPGPGLRETPLAGVVLTDAELDHCLGIARLREAANGFAMLAPAPVRDAVRDRLGLGAVLMPYTAVQWRELPSWESPLRIPLLNDGSVNGRSVRGGSGISIGAVPISAKRPRYAGGGTGAAGEPWSVALNVQDRGSGRTLLYAPALAAWSEEFEAAARAADCVIVDGTFWDDDEPRRVGLGRRTATGMGHVPVSGPGGTAVRLSRLSARCLYTHLNNTNPLTDPLADEHRLLAEWGLEVAEDSMVIDL